LVLYEEAVLAGYLVENARAGLVRALRKYMPLGLNRGDNASFVRSRVFAAWSSSMHDEYSPATDEVWHRILAAAPDGWLPLGPDDAILAQAFAGTEQDWDEAKVTHDGRSSRT